MTAEKKKINKTVCGLARQAHGFPMVSRYPDLTKCDMSSDFCSPFDTWHVTYWKNVFSWEAKAGKHFCLEHVTVFIYNF